MQFTWLKKLIGYKVTCEEYSGVHLTWSREEALEWVACYPWATISRRGQIVAARG